MRRALPDGDGSTMGRDDDGDERHDRLPTWPFDLCCWNESSNAVCRTRGDCDEQQVSSAGLRAGRAQVQSLAGLRTNASAARPCGAIARCLRLSRQVTPKLSPSFHRCVLRCL